MSPADNRRGILAMLCAMLFFITNDTLLKLASASLPPGQIMAVRGLIATMMALCIVAAMGDLRSIRKLASPLAALRACLEAVVAFLFISSLSHLPLAIITAIVQSTPLIMTAAMVVLGLERVRWRRWSAIAVGFIGVLVIVRPGPEGLNVYALVALATAVLVAGRDLATRFVPPDVPSTVVALASTAAVGLAGALAGVGETWPPLGGREMAYIVGAAILVTLGNLANIMAFRGTDVSVVSPFRYSVILWAILLGMVVFGELPDPTAFLGIALIAGSGVYTIHRERVRRRQAARAEAALEPREAA
ncbi:MAG TPA: DMT family transporter [Beijerinckiaceae bacterium]|jgi:drug/metabolite transporter (DMT)-like permease